MKRWTYYFLLLSLAIACTTRPIKETPAPELADIILAPTEDIQAKGKTPRYESPTSVLAPEYVTAIGYIEKHANTAEFAAYVVRKNNRLAHTPHTPVEAMKLFREQLAKGDVIQIRFYTPAWKSRAIGGWDGKVIHQNTKIKLNAIERAGHLLHETSHKYGWDHVGNYANRNDNQASFPYVIGNEFEAYLIEKETALAGDL